MGTPERRCDGVHAAGVTTRASRLAALSTSVASRIILDFRVDGAGVSQHGLIADSCGCYFAKEEPSWQVVSHLSHVPFAGDVTPKGSDLPEMTQGHKCHTCHAGELRGSGRGGSVSVDRS